MIVDKNGIINIQNLDLKIGPDFTFEELKSNSNFKDITYNGSNDNYVRYIIEVAMIDGLLCSALLIFYNSKIFQINFSYQRLISKRPEDRTKEQVDQTKQKHDEWLSEYYGDNRKKFPWGGIISTLYDGHTYDASIAICYNGSQNEWLLSQIY